VRRAFATAAASIEHYASAGLAASSHHIDRGNYQLHVRQIVRSDASASAPVAVILHGAIANGRMFYSDKALGLGPFLAQRGFNVFVPDLRGRGRSSPAISDEAAVAPPTHGQHEAIREDVPTIIRAVAALSGRARQSWAAHSWGGVLLQSAMAHSPELARAHCDSLTCFGTKKHIGSPQTLRERRDYAFDIAFGWHVLCPLLARAYGGYVPARALGFGGDDDTGSFVEESSRWVRASNEEWRDARDGFDYLAAYRALGDERPPTWHLAGANDTVRGNPRDVHSWAEATGNDRPGVDRFTVLSRAAGHLEDYDHNSMLLSKAAPEDTHWEEVAEWMLRHAAARDCDDRER